VLLQWRSGASQAETAERHRVVLASTGRELPDAAAEQADPREADGQYRVAETGLRLVAAGGEHPALTRALTQYGFFRNLRGLRVVWMLTSAVAVGVGIWLAATDGGRAAVGLGIAAIGLAYGGILFWLIDDDAVRANGDSYARTLFEACA